MPAPAVRARGVTGRIVYRLSNRPHIVRSAALVQAMQACQYLHSQSSRPLRCVTDSVLCQILCSTAEISLARLVKAV